MEARAPAATRNRFDQAERDRIRRALLRYMQAHAIGVPTLQKEIAAANDLALDRVPLKTLQRFLGNTHRSNDAMVRFCDQFLGGVPDTDPIAELGEQVAAFLGVWRDGHDCRPVPPDLAGSFNGRARRAEGGGSRLRVMAKDPGEGWVPFSRAAIALLPGRAFATFRETIDNWKRHAPGPEDAGSDPAPRRAYEGIVIYPNGALFALMRNILTGSPRVYWLGAQGAGRLTGHGHEAAGSLGSLGAGLAPYRTTEIIFDREPA